MYNEPRKPSSLTSYLQPRPTGSSRDSRAMIGCTMGKGILSASRRNARAGRERRRTYFPIEPRLEDLEYYGDSERLLHAIRRVVSKLPKDNARFVLQRCVFISIGLGSFGMTLPARIATHAVEKRTRNMWLIILDERIADDEAEGLVAHEIAHAWLHHDQLSPDTPDSGEADAAILAKSWGFTGKGTDPGHCDGR